MQHNSAYLRLQMTHDQLDNIKLYDRKIEKREPDATECNQCRLTKNAWHTNCMIERSKEILSALTYQLYNKKIESNADNYETVLI